MPLIGIGSGRKALPLKLPLLKLLNLWPLLKLLIDILFNILTLCLGFSFSFSASLSCELLSLFLNTIFFLHLKPLEETLYKKTFSKKSYFSTISLASCTLVWCTSSFGVDTYSLSESGAQETRTLFFCWLKPFFSKKFCDSINILYWFNV